MELTVVDSFISDDGCIAVLFSNGSLSLVRDPPLSEVEAFEAAAYFLPGQEPFWVRRSSEIPNVTHVHPIASE